MSKSRSVLLPPLRTLPRLHLAVRRALFPGLAACLSVSALAQTPRDQTLPTVKVKDAEEPTPPITQIGKTLQLLRDVPQTITVLDRAVLDAQGATTLGDALRNVPGITLSAGEGGVIGDNINLRGFSARTDLYVDGIRDRGQYAREIFFLESVEVLKGPSSMLFGRGSTGGVINQVSKQPRRRELFDVGASVGTESYYRASADFNRPLSDSAAWRIAAFAHRNESTRDVIESERFGIAPSLRFDLGAATELSLSGVLQRRDDIPDYGFPIVNGRPLIADRDNFYGFTDDAFDQDVEIASARITHGLSPALTLRNQTQWSSARIHAAPTRINAARVRERLERDIDERALFNQIDVIANFATGSLRHTVTAGLELGRDDYENQGFTTTGEEAPLPSFQNPVYGRMPAIAIRMPNTFTDNRANTFAAYANDTLEVGEHWKLIAGLRFDRFEFDSKSLANSSGALTVAPTKTDRDVSTRAGIVYQPDDVQTYYVSYGTSFNPSAETLTLNAANRNVDPEENRSFELGGKWSLADAQVLITSAVFRVEKTNARTNDPLLGVTLDGETRVDGFELGISGPITRNLRVLAGYSYLDGEIVKLTETGATGGIRDGNALPNTPKHNATFWSTYSLPRGFEIGGGLVYSDERLLNNANTAMVNGYTRIDATIAYVATRYSLRLNALNVADKEYFDVASAGRATPAAGRSALATLNWKF